MKIGDLVEATWTDGLVLTGVYTLEDRGYIILIDEKGNKIVCNSSYVNFKVINEHKV